MTPTTKKTAAEAATSTTANENLSKDSIPALYMLKLGDNTRDCFGTWSGTPLPKSDFIEVAVRFSDLQAAYKNRSAEFTVNLDCVHAYDAHIYKLRAQEEAEAKRAAERNAAEREENEIIHRITGMDLVRDDLVVFMTQARRDGEDFQPYLDALQAIDDLDLKRAGLTTWDVDLDELDAEEGGDDV